MLYEGNETARHSKNFRARKGNSLLISELDRAALAAYCQACGAEKRLKETPPFSGGRPAMFNPPLADDREQKPGAYVQVPE